MENIKNIWFGQGLSGSIGSASALEKEYSEAKRIQNYSDGKLIDDTIHVNFRFESEQSGGNFRMSDYGSFIIGSHNIGKLIEVLQEKQKELELEWEVKSMVENDRAY